MEHKHFVTIDQEIISFSCYISKLYYQILDDDNIGIIREDYSGYDHSFLHKSETTFTINTTAYSEKEILEKYLIDFFSYRSNCYGYPSLMESDLFSSEEIDDFIKLGDEIMDQRDDQTRKAGKNHPLILFCTEHNLYPEPEGSSPYNWQANCPSGRAHHFYLSTHSSTWGCGYCKRKGGLEELKEWVKER